MTPAMVMAMIRDLPENSRWTAWFHDPARGEEHRQKYGLDLEPAQPEPDESEIDWYAERRAWTHDRMLAAMVINRLSDLIKVVPSWEKGKEPKIEPVGPADWRSEEPDKKRSDQPTDKLAEVMAIFGYSGPIEPPKQSTPDRLDDAMAAFGYSDTT